MCLKYYCMCCSVDPDQMPHSATSDLRLHCLQRPICPNTYGYYGITKSYEKFIQLIGHYHIYPKYWKTITPYHICLNIWISPFYYPLMYLGWVANSADSVHGICVNIVTSSDLCSILRDIIVYLIQTNYRTYPYKRKIKQFLSLQVTAPVLLSTVILKSICC